MPVQVIDSNEVEDTVRTLAYSKWEDAGRPDDREEEFWLEAEDEVTFDNDAEED